MISEDQKRAFAEYGFLVLEDFLTGDEVRESALACDELGRQAADWEFSKEDFNLEAPVGRVQGQDGKRRSYTGVIRAVHYIEQHSPWFAELPHRKRLEEDVIQSLLDTQSTHYLSGIHCNKPARVGSGQPWHQDFGHVNEDALRQLSDAMTIWIAISHPREWMPAIPTQIAPARTHPASWRAIRFFRAEQLWLDIDEHLLP